MKIKAQVQEEEKMQAGKISSYFCGMEKFKFITFMFPFWFLAASGKSHYFYSIEFLITKKSLNSNTKNSDYTAGKIRDLETNQIIDRITCDF